ncbi:MAG: aromatic amino acid lyase, partial [Hymenobacteraceae bacterium]|nr:aromatic amino acid lyase [Hymenobacteraceae bacterium]
NQEDHVSMGANAATKLYQVVHNLERVLAIELMNAAQAMEFRKPLQTSPALAKVVAAYREVVPFVSTDRVLHDDIMQSIAFLRTHTLA